MGKMAYKQRQRCKNTRTAFNIETSTRKFNDAWKVAHNTEDDVLMARATRIMRKIIIQAHMHGYDYLGVTKESAWFFSKEAS